MRDKTKGNIALLITAIVWGTGFIGQKIGMATLPAIGFNGTRQVMATFILLPFVLVGLRKSGYFNKDRNSFAVIKERKNRTIIGGITCGILMSLGSNLQQVGLMTVSAGKSGFLTALYIIMVPILGIFFGVKLTKKVFGCSVLAVIGFAFLSLRGGLGGTSLGDWLTLLSALCFAFQIIAVNHFVDKDNDLSISVIQAAFTGLSSLAVSFIFENYTWQGFVDCIPVLLYMALVPTAIGFTLQIVGQKYTDSATASFLMSLESVFAVIFGALILGETMSLRELIGCALIFASNIIVQLGSDEEKPA